MDVDFIEIIIQHYSRLVKLKAGGNESTCKKERDNVFMIDQLTSPFRANARLRGMEGLPPFAVPLAKKPGLDCIPGCLIAEIIIGPFGLSLLSETEVMMLFLVGLELRPSLLLSMGIPIPGMGGTTTSCTCSSPLIKRKGIDRSLDQNTACICRYCLKKEPDIRSTEFICLHPPPPVSILWFPEKE